MYGTQVYALAPWAGWDLDAALGIDVDEVASEDQRDGALSFDRSFARVSYDPPLHLPPAGAVPVQQRLVAQAFPAPTISDRGFPTFSPVYAEADRPVDRVLVGGRDITWWRGAATPTPRYELGEPLLWLTASLDVPQVCAAFETPGEGDLAFMRPGAPVVVLRHQVERVIVHPPAGAYTEAVVGDGAVRYWRMADTSGPALAEEIADADGTVIGTVTFGTGAMVTGGQSITTPQPPTLANVSSVPIPTLGADHSVELWWSNAGSGGVFVGVPDGGPFGAVVSLDLSDTVAEGGYLVWGSGFFETDVTPPGVDVLDGEPHHIVITQSSSDDMVRLYIDGEPAGAWSAVGPMDDPILLYLIDRYAEVAAYPTALTVEQVAAHYAAASETGDGGEGEGTVEVVTETVVDYRGIVVGYNTSGGTLTIECGGHASGRAALLDRQPPLIQWRQDIGRIIAQSVRELGVEHDPPMGPVTGIEILRFGGVSELDFLQQLNSMAVTDTGGQWSTMPDQAGIYRTAVKDTATIHGTVYHDDARIKLDLRRDIAEEPNRVFATGITPAGMIVRFGAYPGLLKGRAAPYPFDDGRAFGPYMGDESTDSGDGITVMIWRLILTRYMDNRVPIGIYDNDVAQAIRRLQRACGITVTGTMNKRTWNALFDLSATGWSLRRSRILPAAADPRVIDWRRTASGGIIGTNPARDPGVLRRDKTIDVGSGFTRRQIESFAASQVATVPQWAGTLTISTGAIVRGTHTPGAPIGPESVLPARDIKPGMNLRLPHFAGGITVHVAGVSVTPPTGDAPETVTCVVDTQARDLMTAWQVIQRDRESRNTPHRAFMQARRKAVQRGENLFDEVGGTIERTKLPAGWTVVPVIAKQAGTVNKLRLKVDPAREFAVAVFGRRISAAKLRRMIGNPLTKAGRTRWDSRYDDLERDHVVLYVAGHEREPCGYFPGSKSDLEDDETPVLTGRWVDDASWDFYAFSQTSNTDPSKSDAGGVIWMAIYVPAPTVLDGGRVMWPRSEEY